MQGSWEYHHLQVSFESSTIVTWKYNAVLSLFRCCWIKSWSDLHSIILGVSPPEGLQQFKNVVQQHSLEGNRRRTISVINNACLLKIIQKMIRL